MGSAKANDLCNGRGGASGFSWRYAFENILIFKRRPTLGDLPSNLAVDLRLHPTNCDVQMAYIEEYVVRHSEPVMKGRCQ